MTARRSHWAAVALPFLLPLVVACAPARVKEGVRLYQLHCAACHGANALGTSLAPPIHPESRRHIVQQVRSPAGQMPAFSLQQLNEADLEKIAEFLLYLHQGLHQH